MFIQAAYAQEAPPPAVQETPAGETPAAGAPEASHGEALHTETGHAADGHGGFPPFDATTFPSQLLWLAIALGLLYVLISRIAAPRIALILEGRHDRIAGDLAEAERMREETDAAIAAYEQALAEARKKATALAAATREGIAKDTAERRKAMEGRLSVKLNEAEAEIGRIKRQAMAEVDQVAAETTEAIVAALIGTIAREDAAAAVSAVRRSE